MKKLSFIFTLILGMFFATDTSAQTTADYFAGKWNVTVFGTPNGDSRIVLVLKKENGQLIGAVRDSTDTQELTKITQIDQKDKSITAAFHIQDYDVTLMLEPVDENHTKGNVLGMFDAKGVRIKEHN